MAPGEIRELVARLTEQSVEAVPVHASRTLEGLAIETGIPVARLRDTLAEMRRKRPRVPPAAWVGFVFLAAVAGWALRPSPTIVLPVEETPSVIQPKPAPIPKITADLSGTVPLTNVTYGPDGGNILVDPSFQPSVALPEGLSVSATVGNVLWGSGDHRVAVLQKPLTPLQEKALRSDVEELLRHVRREATRRHLDLGADHRFLVTISNAMYYGGGGTSLSLPVAGVANDKLADAAIRQAAKQLLDQIQQLLRQQDRSRRLNGP